MKQIQDEINRAATLINTNISKYYKMIKACYKEYGKGAYLFYTSNFKKEIEISELDYRTKSEALAIFDGIEESQKELSELIDNNDETKYIIVMLITGFNNATCFVKLKYKK